MEQMFQRLGRVTKMRSSCSWTRGWTETSARKYDGGWTPLHDCAGRGHKDVVELLLDEGGRRQRAGPTWLDSIAWRGGERSQGRGCFAIEQVGRLPREG